MSRLWALVGAAVLACASGAGAQEAPGCTQRLCNAPAISGFLARLASPTPQRLHIVQIGDSLTIGDMIPNGWRLPLQQTHGAAGRGVVPPGVPFVGYHTSGVTVATSAGWRVNAIFGLNYRADAPANGISGFTQTAAKAGAWMVYTADNDANRFDTATICAATGPGAGAYKVSFEGQSAGEISLDAPRPGLRCDDFAAQNAVSARIETTDDRPVSLTSVGLFGARPGVVLSNLGVIGSQTFHQFRAADTAYATELQHYRPDLVVLAFGTNEAFNPEFDASAYRATLTREVVRIRAALGAAQPILLIAPPDAATRQIGLGRPGSPDAHACERGLMVPANLALIRRTQSSLAQELGLALWDAGAAMGGPCTSLDWQARGMMRPDLVHITREGGLVLGALLAADLEGAAANTQGR